MKHNYEAPSFSVFYAFCFFFLFSFFPLQAQFVINENLFTDEISLHRYAQIANLEQKTLTIEEILLDKELVFQNLATEIQL